MRRLAALAAILFWSLAGSSAQAWDAERDVFERDEPREPIERQEPEHEAVDRAEPETEPSNAQITRDEYAVAEVREQPVTETPHREATRVESPREPAPAIEDPRAPDDVYRVTEVHVADVTTRKGDVIRYDSVARHEDTTSYARVLETVGTGTGSAYDGRAYNGRGTLTDGRRVGGTFYEFGDIEGDRFVARGVVFFQDDEEVVRQRGTAGPEPEARTAGPPDTPDRETPRAPDAAREPLHELELAPPPLPNVRIGVDPTGGSGLLRWLEVARGRRYALRVNAASDGQPVAMERWSLDSGTDDAPNPPGWHAPGDNLAGEWLRLAPPGTPWRLTLRVQVRVLDGSDRGITASDAIEIWVRSPALVE